jgi:hypothetical protein
MRPSTYRELREGIKQAVNNHKHLINPLSKEVNEQFNLLRKKAKEEVYQGLSVKRKQPKNPKPLDAYESIKEGWIYIYSEDEGWTEMPHPHHIIEQFVSVIAYEVIDAQRAERSRKETLKKERRLYRELKADALKFFQEELNTHFLRS